MTEFEKYFIKIHHELDELGIEHWLIGSSLLGLVREGKMIEGDKEANFGIIANNLIKVRDILENHYRVEQNPSIFNGYGVFLIDKDFYDEKWKHPIGFTWIVGHIVSGKKVYQTIGTEHLFHWDTDILLPLTHKKYLGEMLPVPANPEKWLEDYYGPEWKIRKRRWHWSSNSHNHLDLKGLLYWKPKLMPGKSY